MKVAAFRAWELAEARASRNSARLRSTSLVVNGVLDSMIPIRNLYFLAEHLPNAMLVIYPDVGHGSLFLDSEVF